MEENNTSRFVPYGLIQKELDGVISDQERMLLEHWLFENPENQNLYDTVRFIYSDLTVLEQYKNVNVNSHWDKFKLQFDEVSVDQQEQVIVKRGWSPWMKLVAAAVLLLVGIFSYVNFDQWMGYEVKLYGTAKQERILLPDSSVMILYAGGEAIFNKKTFNEKRVVDLKKGKAFFDVKHEVNYPFVVNLANNYVRDIGTSFEINLLAADVEVLVKEGSVALSGGKGPEAKEMILKKNEKGLYIQKTGSLSKINLNKSDPKGKVTQKFNYSNERLDSICIDLERRFQTNIVVIGDNLKARKLSLYFDEQSLNEVVQILSRTLNVKWKADKKGYSIYE